MEDREIQVLFCFVEVWQNRFYQRLGIVIVDKKWNLQYVNVSVQKPVYIYLKT